jgi:F0F1-type ATP synthase delta subunit
MKAVWYAEALHSALKGKEESDAKRIIARFSEVVRARGHAGLFARIAQNFQIVARRAYDEQKVLVVTAHEKGRARGAFAYEHYQKEGTISSDAISEEMVDETIVGGYQLRGKHMLVDQSYKRLLADLYKNITHKH